MKTTYLALLVGLFFGTILAFAVAFADEAVHAGVKRRLGQAAQGGFGAGQPFRAGGDRLDLRPIGGVGAPLAGREAAARGVRVAPNQVNETDLAETGPAKIGRASCRERV